MDQEEQHGPEEERGQGCDWANLPGDFLYAEIASRLDIHDEWAFRRVCRGWRSSSYFLGDKLPFRPVADGDKIEIDVSNMWQVNRPTLTQPNTYIFRSNAFIDRRSYTYRKDFPDLMGCRVVGTYNAWWLVFGTARDYGPLTFPVFLFNPFTESRIPLPPLSPKFQTDVHFTKGIWVQMASSPVSDDFLVFGLMLKNLTTRACLWACSWMKGWSTWQWDSGKISVPTVPPHFRRMVFNRDGLFTCAIVEWVNKRVIYDPIRRVIVGEDGDKLLEPYPNCLEPYPTCLFDWLRIPIDEQVVTMKFWEHNPAPPPGAAGPPPGADGPPPGAAPLKKSRRL